MVVSEAYVGKSIVMKRMRARARGRAARILKPFSKLTILLKKLRKVNNGTKSKSNCYET